ncbi:hypothetical protein DENSPDRAFT_835058 [Dentipellis sp. KUC8613]|nr:hypothetical protein DENSPDRAFT_835058 [Dentipellis sp. KUC8613]
MSSTPHIPFTQLSSLPTYTGTSPHRLQSLYADISRQKQSNPTTYQSNVAWWRSTLEAIVSRGWQPHSADKLILHADPDLPEALRFEGTGKPLCLGTVIAELSSARALIPLTQFTSATQSIYDPGWLPYRVAAFVLGKPLWWALQQTGIVGADDGGHESDAQRWRRVRGEYVVVGLVERAAEAVVARQRSRAGAGRAEALYSFEGFREAFAGVVVGGVLSDADLKVLVRYLERDKKVVVVDKDVIKFVESASPDQLEITSVDRGILELKTAVASLSAQVDNIHQRIDGCTAKASDALRAKRQAAALTYIRSRKQLEGLLKQRLGSLEILQSTLIRVEAAADDIQIMKTYESSTSTLKALLADPALQRDSVDKTLDALAEATTDAREIDDAIRVGGDMARVEAGVDLDEDELERELAALAAEAEQETKDKEEKEQSAKEKEREAAETEELERRLAGLKTGTTTEGTRTPVLESDIA